ncbi:methyltransferase type 11 [Fusarium agapanthi]|uniref:Methyltransferase type 11 n=1 Tax=Fusarium agapanthi TaxID=1803897 RepID=A0A9P5B6A6_9HYPO|nr:methyltransferase type 11 [Fusarium agapanthi]
MTSIVEWIRQVPSTSGDRADDVNQQQDLKILGKRAYLSPESDDMNSSTPKRRKTDAKEDDWFNDIDTTPRAPTLPLRNVTSPVPSISPSKRSVTSSQTSSSRASSSRQKLSDLQIADEGIQIRHFESPSDPWLPKPIKDALVFLTYSQRGQHVFSPTLDKNAVASIAKAYFLDETTAFSTSQNSGSHLSPSEAGHVLTYAKTCFQENEVESVWNVEVHQRLLEKVLRRSGSNRLLDFRICTTAGIIREYLPSTTTDRKIDFCFCIDTAKDATYATKAIALRQSLPGSSLNHSNKVALQARLLPVSIETKRASIDFEGAILQISIWQAAHWKMLRYVLGQTWPTSQSGLSRQDYINEALAELGALPGILIQGHQWYYFASSPDLENDEGKNTARTLLWLQKPIGSTENALGIHQIAAFLEFLKTWSLETYWPWFKSHFFDTPS